MKYAPQAGGGRRFSRALGGGCEVVLHSDRAQASAETYMGLVEVGVGLIPAAGGCKEMLLRFENPRQHSNVIGQAKVSGSAEEARELGLTATRGSHLHESGTSRRRCQAIRHSNLPAAIGPARPERISRRAAIAAFARMRLAAWTLRESGYITDHDFVIGEKLAYVFSGGHVTPGALVSEQNLLDLEREAFLSA